MDDEPDLDELFVAKRKPKDPDDLTPTQEAYCRARALGMSTKEALEAIGSDLAQTTANAWERRDAVKRRISELSGIATENAILKTGLEREWVISRLMNVAERCMQAEPILDRKGQPTGQYKFDAAGANQALKLLGDTMGLFKPAERKPEDEYANLSDDDLARLAGELATQIGLHAPAARIGPPETDQQVIDVQPIPEANRVPQQGQNLP